ncbi:MAG: putative signal transducing protein [Candidatus Binatia bacterium]
MKKVYCAKDPLMVAHLRNVLVLHGIECVTRKLDLATGAGELPPVECWPELWIVGDERLTEAQAILKKTLAPVEAVKKLWVCSGCGERIEGQFSECWKCGRERADPPSPA